MFGLNAYFPATCAACVLSIPLVALTTATPASALIVPLPPADCVFRDGTEVRFHDVDADEISLVTVSGDDRTVVLGFPEKRRGLTISAKEYHFLNGVVGQLQTMIASAETYTLSDVAASFDQDQYVTEIGYLSPDLVRCMTKDN